MYIISIYISVFHEGFIDKVDIAGVTTRGITHLLTALLYRQRVYCSHTASLSVVFSPPHHQLLAL